MIFLRSLEALSIASIIGAIFIKFGFAPAIATGKLEVTSLITEKVPLTDYKNIYDNISNVIHGMPITVVSSVIPPESVMTALAFSTR